MIISETGQLQALRCFVCCVQLMRGGSLWWGDPQQLRAADDAGAMLARVQGSLTPVLAPFAAVIDSL